MNPPPSPSTRALSRALAARRDPDPPPLRRPHVAAPEAQADAAEDGATTAPHPSPPSPSR